MAFFPDAPSAEASEHVPLPELNLDLSEHFDKAPKPQRFLKSFLVASLVAHFGIVGALIIYDLHWKPPVPPVEVPVEVLSEAEAQKQTGGGDKPGDPSAADKAGGGGQGKKDSGKEGDKDKGDGKDGAGGSAADAKAAADKAAADKAAADKAASDKAAQDQAAQDQAKQDQAKQEQAKQEEQKQAQAEEAKQAEEKAAADKAQEQAKEQAQEQAKAAEEKKAAEKPPEQPKPEEPKQEDPKPEAQKPPEKPSPKMEAKARAEAKAQAKAEAAAAKAEAKAQADAAKAEAKAQAEAAKAEAKAEAESAKAEAKAAAAQARIEEQEAKLAELRQQADAMRDQQQQRLQQALDPLGNNPTAAKGFAGAKAPPSTAERNPDEPSPVPYQTNDNIKNLVATSAPTGEADAEAVPYTQSVYSLLERSKQFPETAQRRHARGKVIFSFSIDEKGQPQNVQIVKSSGQADLDVESLATVMRAAPFPIPPEGAQKYFVLTATYGGE